MNEILQKKMLLKSNSPWSKNYLARKEKLMLLKAKNEKLLNQIELTKPYRVKMLASTPKRKVQRTSTPIKNQRLFLDF